MFNSARLPVFFSHFARSRLTWAALESAKSYSRVEDSLSSRGSHTSWRSSCARKKVRIRTTMPARVKKLAVVLHRIKDQPWSASVRHDIESLLEDDPSIAVEFFDPEGSSVEQIRILESCSRQPVDALIVMPIDPVAARPVLRKFRDARAPVIVVETMSGTPMYDACVLGNHLKFGREVGEFFVKAMGGEGDLVEIAGIARAPSPAIARPDSRKRSHNIRGCGSSTRGLATGSMKKHSMSSPDSSTNTSVWTEYSRTTTRWPPRFSTPQGGTAARKNCWS